MSSERLGAGGGGEFFAGGPADGGVAAGVVEEHAAAGFAGEDGVGVLAVGVAVGEVVPALGTDHHLAGGALVVDGFGEAGAFGFGDAVVNGEAGLVDEGAEGGALGFDAGDGGGMAGGDVGCADAGGGEGGGGDFEGESGLAAGDLVLIGALEGGELVVFELGDGLFGEGDLVLEGGDLRGGGGGLHLLAEAGDFSLAVLDFEFLGTAEGLFLGEGLDGGVEGDLGLGAGGLGGGDLQGGIGELGAETAELEVLSLQDDEVFEVGIHRTESPFA